MLDAGIAALSVHGAASCRRSAPAIAIHVRLSIPARSASPCARSGRRAGRRRSARAFAIGAPIAARDRVDARAASSRWRASRVEIGKPRAPRVAGRTPTPRRRRAPRNAARTSSPTSKCSCPIAGPSHAMSCAGGTPSQRTVSSSTPAASPRQPGVRGADARAVRAAKSTGRQSAVRIAHTCLGIDARSAASAVGRRRGRSARANHARAVHLAQPAGLCWQAERARAGGAILAARGRVVADMRAEIESCRRRLG